MPNTPTTTDANGQTTTIEYDDDLLRPTKITPPSSAGVTEMVYTDTPGSISVKTKTKIDSTNYAESTVYADGLGRVIKSEKKDNAGNVFVENQYDIMGRAYKTSNPYRSGDTVVWTQMAFDDFGRIHTVTTPDNAVVTTDYDLSTSGTLATVVTVTDQASKVRRSLTNGLGQLIRIDEPNDSGSLGTLSSPNQATSYSYDTLNNLIGVTQGSQTRTFTYDNLSRLKEAVNPESGAIVYTYDDNGNLATKTDARSVVTTYAYDTLNRVKGRSYSDSTPAVTYYYDGKGLSSTPSYSKGKLTKVSSSISDSKYTSFDNVGKILTSEQITDGQTYTFGYSYNLGGVLLEETYPSGRVVKNTIDTDASLYKVETKESGGSFATRAESLSYTAAGAVSSMKLGNTKWENAVFNSRLQPTQLGLGTSSTDQSIWKVNYDFGSTDNNGNVKSQTITVPTITAIVQSYTYDSLNRIKDATETVSSSTIWKQTFSYDRYGNRRFDTSGSNTTTIPGGCSTAQCNPTIDTSNNRFTSGQGYTYDSSGNLLTDAEGRTFTYDAENKQKTAANSGGTIGTYSYDGDGKRVKKVSSTETTLFVYDASGKMVAEYLLTELTPTTPVTSYLTMDTLGSPRVITDSSGNIISRRDFMPFGEEISAIGGRTSGLGYQVDATRQKFTSYERDSETDLDFAQARMYSNKLGRFTSVDPLMASADIINPQTFNRYAYVGNNPLNETDPTGEQFGINRKTREIQWFAGALGEGFDPYDKLYGIDIATGGLVALNVATGAMVLVGTAEAWLSQEVVWGATAGMLAGSAAALAGVPIATAMIALKLALDPTGRYDDSAYYPEPVREAKGMQQSYWNAFLKHADEYHLMMSENTGESESSPSSGNTQGKTSPADPNSVKPDPNANKPTQTDDEKDALAGGWGKGSYNSAEDSISDHFTRKGSGVGAKSELEYLRKAESFRNNLRGAKRSYLEDGKIRYTKSGRYIILDGNRNILSFGKSR